MNLPRWKCHKEVSAAKIVAVDRRSAKVTLLVNGAERVHDATYSWMEKHHPELGGYFVRYEDGYESFSPARAFESGYTRI